MHDESSVTKEKAFEELRAIEEMYANDVTDVIEKEGITSSREQQKLKREFISKLTDSEELIANMNKYLCFSVENKRFFNVEF